MDDELKFVEGLYDDAEEEIKDIYRQQKKARDELLNQIALVMLAYTVIDDVMRLSRGDKIKEYSRLSKLIKSSCKATGKAQEDIINNILTKTANNTFDFYSYNKGLKDVQAIIDKNFKGKHFSERVWENENQVASHLHKQVNDFLQGKVNVNQIKRNVEKTYNTSAYNAKRLVETEVARVENDSFKRFCNETGVKKVRRNAVLDNRTCNDCSSFDGKVYDLRDAPDLPAHPLCRCFYEIADDVSKANKESDNENKSSKDNKDNFIINLKLLGFDERKELQKLIDNGLIDEAEYNKCYNYFNKQFKKGVMTPIETVYNDKDRFIHIARRHNNMISPKEIDHIVSSLQYPDAIYKTIDKFGIEGKGYIKAIEGKELLTIVRNGIITSYYPNPSYIINVKRGELIWGRK